MDTLLNTYIRQEGNNYQFIHDIIHDAVIKHVNGLESDFKRIILHHCSSKFLNERIRLSSIVHSHTQGEYLILNSDLESEWSARILQDMKNGHWKDLINNTTLHDERGDLLLAESITTLNNTDFQTLIFLSFPCVMVLALLEATQKDSSVFILNISDVTILHLIVYLGLKNCLLEILKSKSVPSVTLQQLNLNLLLLATITGKADIAKVLLENGWSAKDCITESPISLADVSSVYDHDKVQRLLIEHGVDIYKTSKDNHSSLCLPKEYPKEVVKLLFNQTVDECKCVLPSQTPLSCLAYIFYLQLFGVSVTMRNEFPKI